MLLGVSFLYGVAISASIGVLMVMLGSLTLLPALLSIAGGRVAGAGRQSRPRQTPAPAESEGMPAGAGATWLRWSAFVQRRPRTIALAATLVMLLIAAPAVALRLGSSDASNDPASQTTHRAYVLLAQGFGEGFNGPLQVVARVPSPLRQAALAGGVAPTPPGGGHEPLGALRQAIAATPGVAAVAPPRINPAGDVATITVYPQSSPQAYATSQLVTRLRERVIPPLAARTGMTV